MKELVEMHALVHGRVQGIGFRATVREHANRLDIKGTVCNLPTGHVEIYAQGNKEDLLELLECVERDIGLGYVDKVEKKFYSPTKTFPEFTIIYV